MVFTLSPQWMEVRRGIETQGNQAASVVKELCDEVVGIIGKPFSRLLQELTC